MRSRLLRWYILKEFFPSFGLSLLLFTFILISHQLFLIMDLFLNRGVGLELILKMTIPILLTFLPLSIPMASLLASIISYGRLSEDGELTALRSAGCALSQYGSPNILLALLFSIFLVYFNLNIVPQATTEFKNIHHSVIQQSPLALFAPKIMNRFGEYKVVVDKIDRRKKKLTEISIYKTNPVGAPTRIVAPEGLMSSNPEQEMILQLFNGAVHQPNPNKDSEYTITKFNKFSLRIPSKIENEERVKTPREFNYAELQNKVRESIEKNMTPAPWKTERDLRIALAFTPTVFIILGVILGVQLKKGSKSIGIGMSLVIILLYYGLLVLMIPLSSQGLSNTFLLTWTPNLIALFAGLIGWIRLARQ